MRRSLTVIGILLWTGLITGTYYVVQKPDLLQGSSGLAATGRMLLMAGILVFNAYGLGWRVLKRLGLMLIDPVDRLLLSSGTGLGLLGIAGLGFSAAHLANPLILSVIQMGLGAFFFLRSDTRRLFADLQALFAALNLSFSQYGWPARAAITLPVFFSFLLTLAPPFEAFDALLYHLAQPARVLQDGGLRLVDIPHFWFPSLTGHVYLWGLALADDRVPQFIHWTWAVLSALLLWRWAVRVWDVEIGRKSLLLLAGIPSLPMLASWAYADLALGFYALAALYALTKFRSNAQRGWLIAAGMLSGFAISVKYTAFTVPLACAVLLLAWERKRLFQSAAQVGQFGFVVVLTALPWYARNAILMSNPFYPFVFGGRYWDTFQAQWYAGSGSGIGWDAAEILALPLNMILGHRDENFFDGRMGPLFLLLAPAALWIYFRASRSSPDRLHSLQAIGLFAALSFAAWTLGVINTSSLWQARLLFPAVLPLALPAALGWESLSRLDTPNLRISFLADIIIGLIIAATILDNGLFVLRRNPLAVALGAQSREGYIARVNPSYAGLIRTLDELPADACIYSLYEPRSYGLPRCIQPDPINSNLAHDLHLYGTPSGMLEHWQAQGFSHVLVSERAVELNQNNPSSRFTAARQKALLALREILQPVGETPDGAYSVYRIP